MDNRSGPSLHYGDMYSQDKYSMLRVKKYGQIIRKRIKPGAKILDIGCYTAEILDFLPKDITYHGLEYDDAAAKIARQKGAKTFKIDLDKEPFTSQERFDCILAAEVLEHLKYPAYAIEMMARLLKDDGFALISLPNENTLFHRFMSLFGFGFDAAVFESFKHLHLPTIKQSENFVKRHFKIMAKCYYINPSAKGSRAESFAFLFKLVPDFIWQLLANIMPGLFARGVIFSCQKI